MAKKRSAEYKRILIERQKEVGACELCHSKRNLELHHVIPLFLGGTDTDDNLILVCGKCHAQLTPYSLLVKLGMQKSKEEK